MQRTIPTWTPTCPFCNLDVVPGEPYMQEESGWTKTRTGGGTNALRLRKITGRYAHALCVDAATLGVHPDQGQLL